MENTPSLNEKEIPKDGSLKPDFFIAKVSHFIMGGLVVLVLFYFLLISSPINFPKDSLFNLEKGTSLRGVSFELKKAHIIRSRVMFEAFAIMYNGEKHIAQGYYYLDKREPAFVIARRISKGEYRVAPIKVTIPEGFNITEISDTFNSKLPNFNEENFLIKAKAQEGYLFPDTYFFLATDTEENVLEYMRNNFDKRVSSLESEISSFGKSKKDIVTMASIIEKEAKGDADRGLISGILWKRLSIGMPLQVDAAPITYKEKGLPEGPICNPGLEAIKATIHPENSVYLYYLHDDDGGIHFARNFEEHKANKLKYLDN